MKRGFLLNTNHDDHALQLGGRGSSRSHPFPCQDRVGRQFSRGPSPWSSLSVLQLQPEEEGNRRLSQVQTKSKGIAERAMIQKPWAVFCDAEDMNMETEETKTNRNETTSYPDSSVIAPAYVIPARRQNSSSSNISLKSSSLIPESISLLPPPPQSLRPPPPSTSSVHQSFGSSSVPSTLPSTIQSTTMSTITAEPSKHSTTTQQPQQQQQQVAFLPTKTVDVPKAALSGWYGQRPRTHQLSKSQFVSWDDSSPPHRRRFTSLFVCPLTGEIFASGRFGGVDQSPTYHITKDVQSGCDVVWYNKKITAEHAAAARAYDCFQFREYYSTSTRPICLGQDVPYLTSIPRNALPTVPNPTLESQIIELQRKGMEHAGVLDWNRNVDQQMEEQERSNHPMDDTTTIASIPSFRS